MQKNNFKRYRKKFFFSSTYCEIIFHRAKGKYIRDYLIDIRINEAKQLIIEGTTSLNEIAERTGFSDYNYFSRVFKKRVGYTPSQFRKNTLDSNR